MEGESLRDEFVYLSAINKKLLTTLFRLCFIDPSGYMKGSAIEL